MTKEYDIRKRSLVFSIEVIDFFRNQATNHFIDQIIVKQLIRSVTSVGANVQEAKGSQSAKDYINFFSIALKSSNESKYWFEIIREFSPPQHKERISEMLEECLELSSIIASCIIKMRKDK